MKRRLVVVAVVLLASLARAEHTLSVGGFSQATLASFNAGGATGPSLGWLWTRGPFGVGAGLRLGTPAYGPLPLEVYVRGVFTGALGPWEPLLGPELGVSGLSELAPVPAQRPTDFANAERAVHGPLYVAMHTEVLRFRFARVLCSVLGVDVGTSLTAAGSILRLQLDWVTVGVRW
ncbi:MAG: hypothetical protein ACOZQL_31275 [Myxococcota bacterium]